jgi:hypothetical protein
MKKISTILIVLLATVSALAQEPLEYSEVIQAEGRSAEQIYETLQRWVATSWKFPSAAKRYQADNKEIIIDGIFGFESKSFSTTAYSGDVEYNVDIQVREGRLKATMSNFRHTRVRSKVKPLGTVYKEDLTKEQYKEGGHGDIFTTRSVYNGVMKSIREKAEKEWEKIKLGIKAGLVSSVQKEEADW